MVDCVVRKHHKECIDCIKKESFGLTDKLAKPKSIDNGLKACHTSDYLECSAWLTVCTIECSSSSDTCMVDCLDAQHHEKCIDCISSQKAFLDLVGVEHGPCDEGFCICDGKCRPCATCRKVQDLRNF
jgi:hypothetical protein